MVAVWRVSGMLGSVVGSLVCGARGMCSRAARQSQIFSAGDYFDAFFDAEHENHNKKIL